MQSCACSARVTAGTAEKPLQPLTLGQLRSSLIIPARSSGLKSCEPGNNLHFDADSAPVRSCCGGEQSPYGCCAAAQPLSSLLFACAQGMILQGSCCVGMKEGGLACIAPSQRVCPLHHPSRERVKVSYLCLLTWAVRGMSLWADIT